MILTAREVVCEQGSPEWLSIRHGHISPSKFKLVLYGRQKGLNTYLRELREPRKEASNVPSPFFVPSLEWGKYHEPEARSQYILMTGNDVKITGFFIHNELSKVGGSPDALVIDPLMPVMGGLEIKCPYNSDVHVKTLKTGVPIDHLPQIHGYMWLLGLTWWDFVSYDPRQEDVNNRFYLQRIYRDDKFHSQIDERVKWFHGLLLSGGDVDECALCAMSPLDIVPRFF